MTFYMPWSPLASPLWARRGSALHWLMVLFLLVALTGVQARAGPEANPKAKAQQSEVENYNEYNESGEDIYGEEEDMTVCFAFLQLAK